MKNTNDWGIRHKDRITNFFFSTNYYIHNNYPTFNQYCTLPNFQQKYYFEIDLLNNKKYMFEFHKMIIQRVGFYLKKLLEEDLYASIKLNLNDDSNMD